jgi:uncharacterized protein YtpQ (UPF0354 family)
MKRLFRLARTATGLRLGCSKSDILTPAGFTREFAAALRRAAPRLSVVVMKDLELKVTTADKHESTSFLDNGYDLYKQNPEQKADIIKRYIAAGLETLTGSLNEVDRNRIVPVIKDRPWLDQTSRQAVGNRDASEIPEPVFEDFSPDLIVVYAEDTPNNIRYLSLKDLEEARVNRADLRALACENLTRLLPEIEQFGTNGLYMIGAGGDYETSLLLLDWVWNTGQFDVRGDIVVAIPARGRLLMTGSRDAQGIKNIKKMVKLAMNEGAYRLTSKLFVYRNGKFVEFKETR